MKYVVYAFFGVVVMSLVSFIGKEIGQGVSEKAGLTTEKKPEIVSNTGLTEAHRESHIKGCMQVGSNKEYCTCTFDEIKNQYTPESLKTAFEETKATGKIPEPMVNAYNACQYLR